MDRYGKRPLAIGHLGAVIEPADSALHGAARSFVRGLCECVASWSRADEAKVRAMELRRVCLDDAHHVLLGQLPSALMWRDEEFEALWRGRPENPPTIHVHGWTGPAPRWKQAYGRDYAFSGQISEALPTPPHLQTTLAVAQEEIDGRLNGLLVNWYDASLGHYIGQHRDKTRTLINGAPIVTISLGDPRVFRLRPYRDSGPGRDFVTTPGLVIVMPWDTNEKWTHGVPKRSGPGRRVSITIRAFND